MASFLLCFSVFVAAAPPLRRDPRDPIHIPVVRRRHERLGRGDPVDLSLYAKVATNLQTKYHGDRPSVSRRATAADISLTNEVRLRSGVTRPRFITPHPNNIRMQM
jgi:hypothetical protein